MLNRKLVKYGSWFMPLRQAEARRASVRALMGEGYLEDVASRVVEPTVFTPKMASSIPNPRRGKPRRRPGQRKPHGRQN